MCHLNKVTSTQNFVWRYIEVFVKKCICSGKMYTNVKYASYDVTKVEGRESMKMKEDFEARDWKFKEIQVSPSPFKVWGRVNVLRGKKQVLARELQVFLVRLYPSLYPQHSDLQSYPHTLPLCIWSLSGFPIIYHPCILIPIGTSTPFYLIPFPTYLHSWNPLTSGTQSQKQNPQILHFFSQYYSLKFCALTESCSSPKTFCHGDERSVLLTSLRCFQTILSTSL